MHSLQIYRLSWIDEHKKYWRIAVLVLMVAAFISPWGFDLLAVPGEYPCGPSNMRLDENFCGAPLPGTSHITQWTTGLIFFANELLTGEIDFPYGNQLFFIIFNLIIPCLILLPLIATLLLIPGRESLSRQVSRVVVWSLAAGASLTLFTLHAMRINGFNWIVLLPSKIWGISLYFGLAALAIILEILAWKGDEYLARDHEQ